MKKKNKKLNDFWNKIKKPLMIISFIGNILFLIFIIVGCVGTKKQAQQTNAEDTDYYIYDLYGSTWSFTDEIKRLPNGDLWSDYNQNAVSQTIVFDGLHVNTLFYLCNENGERLSDEEIQNINSNVVNKFNAISFYRESGDYYIDFYYNSQGHESNWFNFYLKEGSSFFFSWNFVQFGEGYAHWVDFPEFTQWVNVNGHFLGSPIRNPLTFRFVEQINYNSIGNASLSSPFYSHSFEQNQQAYEIKWDFPYFVSNNQIFNRISIWCFKGYSLAYKDSDGNVRVNDNDGTAYYSYMSYVNTLTDESVMVNYRNFEHSNVNGSVQTYMVNGSVWVNDAYRVLYFDIAPDSSLQDKLAQFNSNMYGSNGLSSPSTNVGIGNVFDLMATAFGGLTGLFGIEILPNITLGLLLFLPLIVGIILTIIWLVKR